MLTDTLLLLALILLNGLFAMAEIAVVGSKRARLLQLVDQGRAGAAHALALSEHPTRFLSSVQVGITSIGILNGAIGEAAFAAPIQAALEGVPVVAPYAATLSLALMVIVLTYVSLILGELVPKRLALTRPEAIASLVAGPMTLLASIGRPIVQLLTFSTDAVLRLFRVRVDRQPSISNEEIKVLFEQGTEEGVFEATEQEMVGNVLDLDQRFIRAVLTPRADVVYLDASYSVDEVRAVVREHQHSLLPLCEGGLDRVVGVVRTSAVMSALLDGATPDLRSLAAPPLFVPETMTVMTLLEQFRRTHLPLAFVVDEFGGVEGLVTMSDVIASIVGEPPPEAEGDQLIVRRNDGSWLVDGSLEVEAVERHLALASLLTDVERPHYHTLGGLAMAALGRVPRVGDVFERRGARFEIVDMDGNRVDRVLVTPASMRPAEGPPRGVDRW
jgi:putative hemolysin